METEAEAVDDDAWFHRELDDTACFHRERDAKSILYHKGGNVWGVDGARGDRGKVAKTVVLAHASNTTSRITPAHGEAMPGHKEVLERRPKEKA